MNRRRQTLGGLSPAQLNVRASLGAVRGAEGRSVLKGSGLGRTSLAPARVGQVLVPRRSSTLAKSGGPKVDPRPLNDKGFQANCVRALISYLSTHGYDQQISPKLLASPMTKDFLNIMVFLMRQVDPSLSNKGMVKPDDEVPIFFKRLKYPFTISKSTLFAVGSPHTWPGLLAALVWLTELLTYEAKAEATRLDIYDERTQADQDFYKYLSKAYSFFIAGDDAGCQQIEDEKASEFQQRHELNLANSRKLQKALADLQQQINDMRNQPSPLEAVIARRNEHLADRNTFTKHIQTLQAHKEALQRKIAEKQADCTCVMEQIAVSNKEVADLQERVAAQTISCDDVARMNNERAKQEELAASARSQREALSRRVLEGELACERRLDALDAAVQVYHSGADRLQLIPTTAKRAGGLQFEICLNRSGATAAEMVPLDLKGGVRAALGHVRETCAARARELGEEALALEERLYSQRLLAQDRDEDAARLTAQVTAAEAGLAEGKATMEERVAAAQSQAEALRADVARMRAQAAAAAADLAASLARVRDLQGQAERKAREGEAGLAVLAADLGMALEALCDHKLGLQALLESTMQNLRATGDHLAITAL